MASPSARTAARAIALVCAGFGAVAVARPGRVAPLVGGSADVARVLGVRDLASAAGLLLSPQPRGAIALRVAIDLSDAVLFGGRRGVAAAALGFAAAGAAAVAFTR